MKFARLASIAPVLLALLLSPRLSRASDSIEDAAVSRWQFKPAMKDGDPVPAKIMVEVDFHLY